MKKIYNVAIIGGGTAGLFCANLLKTLDDVIIIEKNQRLGRKLAQTGNGQGNITNQNINKNRYHGDSALIDSIINNIGTNEIVDFFENLGIVLVNDDKGRIYPASYQAASVCDILRENIEKVQVLLNCNVNYVSKEDDVFTIKYSGGKILAKCVILATGGKAAPHFGTDGSSYKIAQGFGHKITKLYPSLVKLSCDKAYIKGLRGIKINVKATAVVGDKPLFKTQGDVLFTDSGISGNTVFELSAYVTDKQNAKIQLNFLPNLSKEKLLLTLNLRANYSKTADMLMCGIINRQLYRHFLKLLNINQNDSIDDVKPYFEKLTDLCFKFEIPILGFGGFEIAQVTKGGIDGVDIEYNTLQSKLCNNLYLVGELLNVDGDCGGYNIHFALLSAKRAAESILKTLDIK